MILHYNGQHYGVTFSSQITLWLIPLLPFITNYQTGRDYYEQVIPIFDFDTYQYVMVKKMTL